jgi:uncharacterized protein (DUF302 family)
MTPEGMTLRPSRFGPKETADRLAAAVTARGMAVLARIDHAAAAAKAALELRPTELLIFGNAKAGTPLMQLAQTMGIDLPLRALVFEDAGGRTWLAWNDPDRLAERHGIDAGAVGAIGAMATALTAVALEASGAESGAQPSPGSADK